MAGKRSRGLSPERREEMRAAFAAAIDGCDAVAYLEAATRWIHDEVFNDPEITEAGIRAEVSRTVNTLARVADPVARLRENNIELVRAANRIAELEAERRRAVSLAVGNTGHPKGVAQS